MEKLRKGARERVGHQAELGGNLIATEASKQKADISDLIPRSWVE